MNEEIQEIKQYLDTLTQLTDDEKAKYLNMLEQGEDSIVVLDKITDHLQEKLDKVYQAAGIELDENDPEIIQANEELNQEMRAAAEKFDQEMAEIENLANEVHGETIQKTDEDQMQALREKLGKTN